MTESITLAGFEALLQEASELEDELERIKGLEITPRQEKLAALEKQILTTLETHDMKSYRSSKFGTVTRATRYSVPTPKSPEAKAAYFEWLRRRSEDAYWAQITVNSQKLTSFYKEEQAIAREEGRGAEFSIPGLAGITADFYLSWRAK